jgi:hypothetical protein
VKILDALVPQPTEVERYSPPPWMQPFINNGMPDGWFATYGTNPAEKISASFADFACHGVMGNAVIAAIERVRIAVFSEARFQWQAMNGGRPGDMFGNQDLAILERPWVGGTTGDLMARMLLDADLAGNSFWVDRFDEMVRLRPDWVEIILRPRWVTSYGEETTEDDPDARQLGWEKLGYLYYQGGQRPGVKPAAFLPGEVVHFAPNPDPLADYRGMSWLTPVIREIQADTQATKHKLKFFENAASPNLAVKLPKEITPAQFGEFVELMDARHKGVEHAYETLYTGGGADVTVIGADMRQMDFKVTQGAGESRIAAAGGVHPSIVGLSEGLQGSSLNAGNFGAARRLVADATMRPLWRNAAGSLEVIIPLPPGGPARLWVDSRDVAFMREDARDAADIEFVKSQTIRQLVDGGFEPVSVVRAVQAQDMNLLVHTGKTSVQLQQPTENDPAVLEAQGIVNMIQKEYLGVGVLITAEEGRALLNKAGAGLTGPGPVKPATTAPTNGTPVRQT